MVYWAYKVSYLSTKKEILQELLATANEGG